MKASARPVHPATKVAGALGAVALFVVLVAQAAPAARRGDASVAAPHACVVATGSGDQAFTRNFNPFNSGSMRDFTQGGIYETLVISTAFVGAVLSNVFIVPQSIWSKVDKVADFTNPNPVGSGPFTRITRFNGQDYVLSKNPNYWQKGLPKVPCIERIAAAGNDAALLQIVNGEADWTHNFVPNVEKAYIAHDKK